MHGFSFVVLGGQAIKLHDEALNAFFLLTSGMWIDMNPIQGKPYLRLLVADKTSKRNAEQRDSDILPSSDDHLDFFVGNSRWENECCYPSCGQSVSPIEAGISTTECVRVGFMEENLRDFLARDEPKTKRQPVV